MTVRTMLGVGVSLMFAMTHGANAAITPTTNVELDVSLPLLTTQTQRHVWFEYCDSHDSQSVLPPDPRTLVKQGTNAGRAVHFNTAWRDLAAGDGPDSAAPTTCGELKARVARGAALMIGNGGEGAASLFAGSHMGGGWLALPASSYNQLWRRWGLPARPANFEQLVAERYGLAVGVDRNPYPLPGEDPNKARGGSGQLPLGLTQGRNPDGTYNGKISITCLACHTNQIGKTSDGPGLGAVIGGGSRSLEIQLLLSEVLGPLGNGIFTYTIAGANKTRGTSQFPIQLGFLVSLNFSDLTSILQILLTQPSSGDNNPPDWWRINYKLTKFHNGLMPVDNIRTFLLADVPILAGPFPLLNPKAAKNWNLAHQGDVNAWMMSLTPPKYPGPINKELAEKGAVIFHTKNLWDPSLRNSAKEPEGGNGSCAGCHGVYSPRFAKSPMFLETPALRGIAAYVVPTNIVNTDAAYAKALSFGPFIDFFNRRDHFAYGDRYGTPYGNGFYQNDGYQAPPLHGVWASAPYFHNGSVPTVWDVLKPQDRPKLWRRVSTPYHPGQAGKVVMGFDTDLTRAYDHQRLGWRYDTLACGDAGTHPNLECNPDDAAAPAPIQVFLQQLYRSSGLLFNVRVPQVFQGSVADIESRKVYNTFRYSQGNGGHAGAAVLTDDERRALIEYLKTL